MSAPDLPENVKKGRAAALDFLPLMKTKLASPDGSLHAGTMLAAAGWLTGTSLYRSFNFPEKDPPGTIIKEDEVNREWESLVFLLEQYNFGRTDILAGRLLMAGMSTPASQKPRVEMLQVLAGLQEQFHVMMKKHGFGFLDGARAGVVLCSVLLQHYASMKEIDPLTAAGIVAEKVLEAAKTVPPPLRSAG